MVNWLVFGIIMGIIWIKRTNRTTTQCHRDIVDDIVDWWFGAEQIGVIQELRHCSIQIEVETNTERGVRLQQR